MAPQDAAPQGRSETTPLLTSGQQNKGLSQRLTLAFTTLAVFLGVMVVVVVSMNNVDFGKVLDKPTDDAKGAKEEGYTHVWDIDDSNTPVKFTVQVTEDRLNNGLSDEDLATAADLEGKLRGMDPGVVQVKEVFYEIRFILAVRGAGDCTAANGIQRAMERFVTFPDSYVEVGECTRISEDDTYDDKEFDAVVAVPRSDLKRIGVKPGEFVFKLIDRVTPGVFTNEYRMQGGPKEAKCFRVRHGITSAYAVANLMEEEAKRMSTMDEVDLTGGEDEEAPAPALGPSAGPAAGPAAARVSSRLGKLEEGESSLGEEVWLQPKHGEDATLEVLEEEAVSGEGAPKLEVVPQPEDVDPLEGMDKLDTFSFGAGAAAA